MRATGIVRKIDELGRIVLPIELRKTLNINDRDPMEVFVNDDDFIMLKKYEISCIFTGATEDLMEFEGRRVSKAAILAMAEQLKQAEEQADAPAKKTQSPRKAKVKK